MHNHTFGVYTLMFEACVYTVMSWQLVVLQISPAQTKDSFIEHFTPVSPSYVPKTQHLCADWLCFSMTQPIVEEASVY